MKQLVTIGTKIDKEAAAIIQSIAEKQDMTVSELLANAVNIIIRLSSVEKFGDEKLRECVFLWEACEKEQTNLTQNGNAEVLAAIYLLRQLDKRRTEAVMVKKGAAMFDDLVSYDSNEILRALLKSMSPETYRRLARIGEAVDLSKTMEVLMFLLNYYEQDNDVDSNFIQEMFNEQASFHNNHDMLTMQRYKRKMRKTIYDEQRHKLPETDLFSEMEQAGEETEG